MPALTQKYQVTIPKHFRIAAGLRPGDEVEFSMKEENVVIKKKHRELPLEKWRGVLKGINTRKIMKDLRG